MIRVSYAGEVRDNIKIHFSRYFRELFEEQRSKTIAVLDLLEGNSDRDAIGPNTEFEAIWRLQRELEQRLASDLGPTYVHTQVYIPAGRSFFTSLGKAFAVFEHGKLLDPLTIRFGRMYASSRERYARFRAQRQDRDRRLNEISSNFSRDVFDGEIRVEGDAEFVETSDGRVIPFNALSSGQQEILPLWLTLDYWSYVNRPILIYIEEPEAHLFPSAQNDLVEYLASILSSNRDMRLVISTHSPYILTKINNLIKAGRLGSRAPQRGDDVARIVPRSAWIRPRTSRAYAIQSGHSHMIADATGLINADYIDDVSGDIGREFSSLLAIEFAK